MAEKKFMEFVADIMNVSINEISLDTEYKGFPVWDSLMMLNLIMEIEEEYQVRIPLEEVGKIRTLRDLYNLSEK